MAEKAFSERRIACLPAGFISVALPSFLSSRREAAGAWEFKLSSSLHFYTWFLFKLSNWILCVCGI